MRFIFISSDFNQGGVTSSMRNLCNELIRRGHLVDILNLPGDDKLPEGFSNEIRLIPVEGFAAHWNLGMHTVRREKGIKKLTCLLLGAVKKLCNRSDLWNRIVFSNLKLDEKYDIAIGFRQSPVCYWLAASKCKAKISIGFWHTDADFENVKVLEACMAYPDRIACVSDAVTMQMKKKYPHYAEKFAAVYNLFDPEDIRRKCLEASPYGNSGEFKIVTVSRLVNSPKKIDTIPQICLRLARKSNRPFRWYVVGEGADRAVIEAAIQETCTEKYITLCGSQTNPYPFMSNADLFVLCSSWESYGMVIVESLIAGTPVVAGDYPALHEILTDRVNGVIAENRTEAIAEVIAELLNDEGLYQKLKNGAEHYNYSSDVAYRQLLTLVGD